MTNALTQSSRSLLSLRGQPALGAQCPVASQWAVLSVIPAHEPDSHHKAPIVFTGWIGSHSACHSAATCITRRHSGACFCFWFLLSCQPHRATLFCPWAYLTLIWEVLPKLPTQLPTRLEVRLIYAKTIVAKHLRDSVYEFTWSALFVYTGKFICQGQRGAPCARVVTWLVYNLENTEYQHACWFVCKHSNRNQSENGIHS